MLALGSSMFLRAHRRTVVLDETSLYASADATDPQLS